MRVPTFLCFTFVNSDDSNVRMADVRNYVVGSNLDFNCTFNYYQLIRGSSITWGKSGVELKAEAEAELKALIEARTARLMSRG